MFGATGGAGRALVRSALDQGRTVTAFGRSADALRTVVGEWGVNGRSVVGEVTNAAAVDVAVAGQDAVLVALGPRKGDDPAALTRGVQVIGDSMARHGVRRLVLISGAGIRVAGDQKPAPDALISGLVRLLNRADVEAKEAQLAYLETTALAWTVVRPPRLVDRPGTGRALVADPHTIRGGRTVPYADLALWMLEEADAGRFVRRAVFVAAG